jgi:hypothetical protein
MKKLMATVVFVSFSAMGAVHQPDLRGKTPFSSPTAKPKAPEGLAFFIPTRQPKAPEGLAFFIPTRQPKALSQMVG